MNTFLSNQTSIIEQRAEESRKLAVKLLAVKQAKDLHQCLQSWVNRDCSTGSSSSNGAHQQ